MRIRLFALVLFLSGITGLSGAENPSTFKVGELQFTRPAAWEWVQTTSSMRKAQLKVPGSGGKEAGEVIFFHFGAGGGGGTQANVDRWLGQFSEPRDKLSARIEGTEVGGHRITYVRAEGTYKSGMPGGPTTALPGHALAGAIVEDAGGSVFIRLTAPKPVAEGAFSEFKKMVESGLRR